MALSLIMAGPVPAQQAKPKPPPGATQTPPPPQPRASLITNPAWARHPQPDYPAAAIANGVTAGRVTLRCLVQPDGSLLGCEVIEETPPGQGFAASVIAATVRARLAPRTVDGAAVGARVQFTTRFIAPEPFEPTPPRA